MGAGFTRCPSRVLFEWNIAGALPDLRYGLPWESQPLLLPACAEARCQPAVIPDDVTSSNGGNA